MNPFLTNFSRLALMALVSISAPSLLADVGPDNPTGVTGVFNGNSHTGCSYDPYTANAQRIIPDLTVAGAVGAYPLRWSRIMNSRLPGGGYFGQAGGWQHSYQWKCTAASGRTNTPNQYTVSYPDGRVITFTTGGQVSVPYRGPMGINDRFQGAQGDNRDCFLLLSDGGKVKFRQHASTDDTGVWDFTIDRPTLITDPYSLSTTLTYDPVTLRLTQVTEPAGRSLKIYYNTSGIAINDISKVEVIASDGHVSQWVQYYYQAQNIGTLTGIVVLTSATYIGSPTPTATYTYQPSNQSAGGTPLIWTCRDVRYPGPMKNIKYAFVSGGVYGQLYQELNYNGALVAQLTVSGSTRTERRGDLNPDGSYRTRTFTYGATLGSGGSTLNYLLKSYTDFVVATGTPTNTTTFSYDVNGHISAVEDGNHNTTSFARLTLTGAITMLTHPDGTHIDYVYEDPTTGYYVKTVTTELGTGHTITYQHGNTTTMTTSEIDYPDGGVEKYTYNGYNQPLSHTFPSNTDTGTIGGTETFTYDTNNKGLLVTYTPPSGLPDGPIQYGYDANDHLHTVTDGRGNQTILEHNEIGQLTIITYPNTDPGVVGYTYNTDGTLALQNVQLNSTTFAETDYTYDDYKRPITFAAPQRFDGDTTPRTTYLYYAVAGGAGADLTHTDSNVTRIQSPSGHVGQFIYDANYRKDHTTIGYGTTDSATTYYDYDAVGSLTKVTDPKSHVTSYFYDTRNRLIGVNDPIAGDRNTANPPHTVSYAYDGVGNLTSEQRANDQVVTYDTYDAMNRLTQMTVPQTGTANCVTHYTWTKAGKLHTMTDPRGKAYNYDYDTLNRLVTTTYPVATGETNGRTELRTYDAAGNLRTYTTRDGHVQTFSYDTRNRDTAYSWSSGANVQPRTVTYDDASRITSCNTTNTFINFTYYNDNLLHTQEEWGTGSYGNNAHRTITYAYNADGLRASVTYPGLPVPSFTYDYTSRNQLLDMISGYDSSHVVDYTYDSAGFMTNRSLPNTTSSVYTPDALNRVTNIAYYFNATSGNGSLGYAYDKMGNRTYAHRGDGTTDGFTYNLNNEMTVFLRNGTLSGGVAVPDADSVTTSYTLDASGNRTAMNVAGVNTIYTPNNLNQYTSISYLGPATYSGNANLATLGAWTYTYDAMNRLTNANNPATSPATNVSFYYDGLNRQVARVETGPSNPVTATTYSVWDGWQLFAEYDASGTQTNRWAYAGSDLVRRIGTPYGTVYFYPEASGSTRYTADGGGTILERYTYDAYGAPTFYSSSETALNATAYGVEDLFTGQRWYPDLGLYDLRNRGYRADIGRFLQPDPIGFGGDKSNLYRYCGNNPSNWSDSSGLERHEFRDNPWARRDHSGDTPGEPPIVTPGEPPIGLGGIATFPGGPGLNATVHSGPQGGGGGGTANGGSQGAQIAGVPSGGVFFGDSPNHIQLALNGLAVEPYHVVASTMLPPIFELEGLLSKLPFVGRMLSRVFGVAAESATVESTITVVHFTDAITIEKIAASGNVLNAESFVTLPGEVEGLNAVEVERVLEIEPGRGAFSTTFDTPSSNLATPFNGDFTSGGKIQFQLRAATPITVFVPTP